MSCTRSRWSARGTRSRGIAAARRNGKRCMNTSAAAPSDGRRGLPRGARRGPQDQPGDLPAAARGTRRERRCDLLTDGGGSARYDARSERHYLRCLRSGSVQDLPTPFDPGLIDKLDPGLTQQLEQQGFRVTGYRLEIVGYYDTAGRQDEGFDEE